MHAQKMLWLMTHGQAFRGATDVGSGARRLLAVLLRATRTCASAASFASCSHGALLKTWQTQRDDYDTVSWLVMSWLVDRSIKNCATHYTLHVHACREHGDDDNERRVVRSFRLAFLVACACIVLQQS